MDTPGAVRVTVNGEKRELPASTLEALLRDLGHDPRTVAVEYNGAILPRREFSETRLRDGDRLEIVRFVQGG